MYQKSFVVLAFPRTGSTLITTNLARYFDTKVIHTHHADFQPPHEDFTCITTRRDDVFALLCSQLVMLRTDETHEYTDKVIEPFRVDPEELNGLWAAHEEFYQTRNLAPYKKVIEVEFQKLIKDPYYLFGQFNIVERTSYDLKQSPHRYQNLILNLDELEQSYNENVKIMTGQSAV